MSDGRSPGADSTAPRVTVEGQGITIEKAFAADEFDTPAIVLTIENERDTPVSMKIIDPLPEELDQSDIGFHPEYAAEGWTRREDGDLQLDRELEAGEQIKSVYGIRLSEVQDPASLLQEPTIANVEEIAEADTEEPGNAAASADDIDQAIPDTGDEEDDEESEAEAADGESDAGEDESAETGETAGAEESEESEDSDRAEAGRAADRNRDRTTARAGETTASLGTPTADGETVAEALAAELERGSVDDETLRTLNDHLSPRLAESSQVRIDNVQARLSDLEAYTEALEGILDTVGTDEDISRTLGTIQDDLEQVAAQTDALRDDLDRTAEDLDATQADLEDSIDDLGDDVESVQSRVEEVDDTVGDVEETVDAVDDRVDDLESELEGQVEELQTAIDDVSEDLEDLVEWRDNFVGAVGGGGGGGGGGDGDEE